MCHAIFMDHSFKPVYLTSVVVMSDIWKYYDKSSANEAQCQICKRKLARKDGSTRGLWKHLEAKHQQDFQQLKGTWNSVYRMLSAFKKQKKVLMSMQFERDQRTLSLPKRPRLGYETVPSSVPQLTAADFEILRYLCPILQIFDVETQKFSREKSTASVILPTLKRICDFLKEEGSVPQILHMFIDNLVCSLNRRVEKLIHNNVLRVCTLLDPRFAYDEDIFSKSNWALIEEDVQEFAKRMENENEFQLEEAGTSSLCDIDNLADDCDERSDDSIKFDIWKPKSPASISLPSAISTTSRIQVQLAAFKVDARPPLDTDIFSWWKQNGAQFPALDKIARVVHSIPATSVSSERLFSKAGLIYGNKLRNRLSGELVEKILVVKANMDNLQLAPSAAPEGEIFESDDVEDQEDQQYVLPEN